MKVTIDSTDTAFCLRLVKFLNDQQVGENTTLIVFHADEDALEQAKKVVDGVAASQERYRPYIQRRPNRSALDAFKTHYG